MSLTQRLDAFQQRHRSAAFPLGVLYKFADDQGSYLAALIAYYGFLSLFPLLLLFVTILGYLLNGDAALQHQILSSALTQFPIIGNQLQQNVHSLHGSGAALAVGIVGSLYGGIGVAQAAQNAMNVMWAIPRNRRPNPIKSRLRSLVAVLVLGAGVVATTVLSGLFTGRGAFGHALGPTGTVLAVLLAFGGNALLFLSAFRFLTAQHIPFRHLVPGAVAAAVGWQLLQVVGTFYVGHSLRHASQVYGLFGLVLGLLGWLYVASLVTVLCAEVNVVRERQLWPRALLTPFTDNVLLTSADERTYSSSAKAQRTKGFEQIDVSFGRAHDPPLQVSGPGESQADQACDHAGDVPGSAPKPS